MFIVSGLAARPWVFTCVFFRAFLLALFILGLFTYIYIYIYIYIFCVYCFWLGGQALGLHLCFLSRVFLFVMFISGLCAYISVCVYCFWLGGQALGLHLGANLSVKKNKNNKRKLTKKETIVFRSALRTKLGYR